MALVPSISSSPKPQRPRKPYPSQITLGTFFPPKMATVAMSQSISKDVLYKQLETKHKRPDGGILRKCPFEELSDQEKFHNIDSRLNGLRRDINQNTFRVYGVQKLPDKQLTAEESAGGAKAQKMYLHEILEQIFIRGLGIEENLAKVMTTSGLGDIYRFRESGLARQYCLIFKLNRSDLCGHVYKNLSKLGQFENPFGSRMLTISKILSEEENKERQRCLAVKDVLKGCGFDAKIKKNIFLTVNGGDPHHYTSFLEGEEGPSGRKRARIESVSTSPHTSQSKEPGSPQDKSTESRKRPLSEEFPPLPRTGEDLTPEQLAKVRAILNVVEKPGTS